MEAYLEGDRMGSRTMLRQDAQIQSSQTYNDTLAPGIALQQSAFSIEDDLSALRSQVSRILDGSGSTRFYADLYTNLGGQKQGLRQVSDSVYAQSQQPFTIWASNLTATAVPSGQNWVVLSVGNAQTPSTPIALQNTTFGAVSVASTLNGSAFAAHELTVLAGADVLNPRNRVTIHNNSNGQPIEDANTIDIFGLLQAESTAVDGAQANDTSGGNRLKISFVKINYATKQLVAASAADLAGLSINYQYRQRLPLAQVPEGAFGQNAGFVDNVGVADITLTRATANQGGNPIPVTTSVLWQVANGQSFKVQNSNGGQDFISIVPTATSTAVNVNSTSFGVTTAQPATMTQGLLVGTSTQTVNLGVTTGQIDSASLTVASTGTGPLKLQSGGPIVAKDAYIGASNWTAQTVTLASGPADYNLAKQQFGEVSLLGMINLANQHTAHQLIYADVTPVTVAAGQNLTGAGSGSNLSAQLPSYSQISQPAINVKVMFNGVLLRPGSNQASGADWYPGLNPATGDIMLNFAVKGTAGLPLGHNDQIAMEVFGSM